MKNKSKSREFVLENFSLKSIKNTILFFREILKKKNNFRLSRFSRNQKDPVFLDLCIFDENSFSRFLEKSIKNINLVFREIF